MTSMGISAFEWAMENSPSGLSAPRCGSEWLSLIDLCYPFVTDHRLMARATPPPTSLGALYGAPAAISVGDGVLSFVAAYAYTADQRN